MKYSVAIEIDMPVNRVIELFDNPDNYDKWMEGLLSLELISGTKCQPGAKTRMKFKMGKGEMEMLETVKVRNFPDEYTVTYEANGVFNIVTIRFVSLPDNRTKYITDQEFQFKGFMKMMAWLMPGAFKKQSMKNLNDFKNYVQGCKSV